jgi:ubiquinone biosynthesis protein COQ9
MAIDGGPGYPIPMSLTAVPQTLEPTGPVPDWAESAEARILDAALLLAPVHGWTAPMVRRAARQAGLSDADAALLLPHGAQDLAALLSRRHDGAALRALGAVDPRSLKVRDRIQRGVQARVEAAAADQAAVRRLLGFLAQPHHVPLGARLLWESADTIWRWAGDKASDENHYSKRLILSGVLGPAIALRLSAGPAAADHYVVQRIDDLMTFERWKAKLPKTDIGVEVAQALGKVRYSLNPSPAKGDGFK